MADLLKGDKELLRRLKALEEGKADRQILTQFGLLAVRFAKDEVPRKTGNLGRTIRVASVDPRRQQVRVVAGGSRSVGYAGWVEFGTRAHTIRPVRRKALAWGGARRLSGNLRKGARATNFATIVRHPGTRPHPYLVPGAKRALAEVDKAAAVIKTWNEAA
jgi:hypothetical protein